MSKSLSIEDYLEKKLVEWVRSVGGEAFKGNASQYKGIPDRIVVLPMGGTVWVECKGGTEYGLTPMQQHFRKRLLKSDAWRYFVLDSKEDLERCIAVCKCLMSACHLVYDAQARTHAEFFDYYMNNPDAPIEPWIPDDEEDESDE